MILIVGLGNPGNEYEGTRHNVGFVVLDALAERIGSNDRSWRTERDAAVLKNGATILTKPLTYMNASGTAVRRLLTFYKISPADLWVVHDEVDLPFGTLRVQFGASSAGHKGVESVIGSVGTKDFWRFRVGIGRPADPHVPTEDFVLQRFTEDERKILTDAISNCVKSLQRALESDPKQAAEAFSE